MGENTTQLLLKHIGMGLMSDVYVATSFNEGNAPLS